MSSIEEKVKFLKRQVEEYNALAPSDKINKIDILNLITKEKDECLMHLKNIKTSLSNPLGEQIQAEGEMNDENFTIYINRINEIKKIIDNENISLEKTIELHQESIKISQFINKYLKDKQMKVVYL
jgi:exodeoxyribonuclease VII small subunit